MMSLEKGLYLSLPNQKGCCVFIYMCCENSKGIFCNELLQGWASLAFSLGSRYGRIHRAFLFLSFLLKQENYKTLLFIVDLEWLRDWHLVQGFRWIQIGKLALICKTVLRIMAIVWHIKVILIGLVTKPLKCSFRKKN